MVSRSASAFVIRRILLAILVLAAGLVAFAVYVAVSSIARSNQPSPVVVLPTDTPVPTATQMPAATDTTVLTAPPEQAVTPYPTATPSPTATPTPRPTATPRPTRTPRPTPTPVPLSQYQGMEKVVAALTVYVETPSGSGSGFFFYRGLAQEGEDTDITEYVIITNSHVVKSHSTVKVCWAISQTCVRGKVTDKSESLDIAVIEHANFWLDIVNPMFRSIVSGKWEGWGGSWDRGDVVYASGYTAGNKAKSGEVVSEPIVTEGIVARNSLAPYKGGWAIEYGAEGGGGSSGGPLMNNAGYIIGVVRGGNPEAERLGVAVPMGYVIRWLDTGEEPESR